MSPLPPMNSPNSHYTLNRQRTELPLSPISPTSRTSTQSSSSTVSLDPGNPSIGTPRVPGFEHMPGARWYSELPAGPQPLPDSRLHPEAMPSWPQGPQCYPGNFNHTSGVYGFIPDPQMYQHPHPCSPPYPAYFTHHAPASTEYHPSFTGQSAQPTELPARPHVPELSSSHNSLNAPAVVPTTNPVELPSKRDVSNNQPESTTGALISRFKFWSWEGSKRTTPSITPTLQVSAPEGDAPIDHTDQLSVPVSKPSGQSKQKSTNQDAARAQKQEPAAQKSVEEQAKALSPTKSLFTLNNISNLSFNKSWNIGNININSNTVPQSAA